jgi:hypothetical protein
MSLALAYLAEDEGAKGQKRDCIDSCSVGRAACVGSLRIKPRHVIAAAHAACDAKELATSRTLSLSILSTVLTFESMCEACIVLVGDAAVGD